MKIDWKTIGIFAFVTFFVWGMSVALTYNHELIHQAIGKEYNVDSTITLHTLGMGGYTKYNDTEWQMLTLEQQESMRNYNIVTEEIDYRLIPFEIFLVGMFMGITLLNRGGSKENKKE